MIDLLRLEVGLSPGQVIADVGSGTGLSTELFLDHGHRVFAVEPNRAMRAEAEHRLGDRPGFHSVAGTAEATTLEPSSVDLVFAAQAFHWFDPAATRREFGRVLRPPGQVVLVWNTRRTGATPFLRAYEDLLVRHGTDYAAVRHDRADDRRLAELFDGPTVRRTLPNEQRLDREGLIGRVLSSSYTPAEGDPRRVALVEAVERLFQDHETDGLVAILYDTEVHMGRVDPATAERA